MDTHLSLRTTDLRSALKRGNPHSLRYFISLMTAFILSIFIGLPNVWAWQYTVSNEVRPGQRAELSVVAPTTLKRVTFTLRSDRSKRVIKKRLKRLSPSKSSSIRFKPQRGMSHWTVEIKGESSQGTERVVFEFDVLSAGPMKINFFNEVSSLEEGRLVFKSSRPLDHVDLEAYGDDGDLLALMVTCEAWSAEWVGSGCRSRCRSRAG